MSYYKHKAKVVKKLKIGSKGVPQDFLNMLGSDGILHVTSDATKVLDYASIKLYQNPRAGVREILNNELRQARIAEKRGYGTLGGRIIFGNIRSSEKLEPCYCGNPRKHIIKKRGSKSGKEQVELIHCSEMIKSDVGAPYKIVHNKMVIEEGIKIICTMNEISREIIIHGIDTMGMTAEEFRDIYIQSGRSGNLDDRETGMFGIGKLAYTAISDTMKFETWARDNTEDRYAFIMEGTKIRMTDCDLDTYGTRVTLKARDDVKFDELETYFRNMLGFFNINIYLEVIKDGMDVGLCKTNPLKLTNELDIIIRHDDYELQIRDWSEGPITAIQGAQIDMDEMPIFPYVLNILNEKMYPPTASRDWMSAEATQDITRVVVADFKAWLDTINWRTLEYKKLRMFSKYELADQLSNKKMDIVNCRMLGFDSITYGMVKNTALSADEIKTKNTINENMAYEKGEQTDLTECHIGENTYYHMEGLDADSDLLKKFFSMNADANVIIPNNEVTMDSFEHAIKVLGVQSVEKYVKMQQGSKVKNNTLTVFTGDSSRRVNVVKIKSDTVRIPKNFDMKRCQEITRRNGADFNFVRETISSKKTDAISLDDHIENTNTPVITSEGVMPIRDIMAKNIKTCKMTDPKFASYDRYIRDFVIYGNIPCGAEIVMDSRKWTITRVPEVDMEEMIASSIRNEIGVKVDINFWSVEGIYNLGNIKNKMIRKFLAENSAAYTPLSNEKYGAVFLAMDSEKDGSKIKSIGGMITKVFSDEMYTSLRSFVLSSDTVKNMDQDRRIRYILKGVFPKAKIFMNEKISIKSSDDIFISEDIIDAMQTGARTKFAIDGITTGDDDCELTIRRLA